MSELAAGVVFGGGYRVLNRIGTGGSAEVYEVAHPRLAGRYALKLLGRDLTRDPEAVARFRREAEVTSALRHPGIVQVVDFDHAPDGTPYLVMEYLDGRELSEVIRLEAPLPAPRVTEIVDQIASALDAAHRKGVVHRDLKPANVFVMEDPATGRVHIKIVDFGISKLEDQAAGITTNSTVLGTPRYMSPEQALGRNVEVDGRTDQFALAAISYELLTGKVAFDGQNLATLAYRIVHETQVPASTIVPQLPQATDEVLARALSKRREDRWPGAIAFGTALRQSLVGQSPTAPTPSVPRLAVRVAAVLATLGVIDLVLRCVMLGLGDGLASVAADPAKVLFHLWFLPAAAFLAVKAFPRTAIVFACRDRPRATGFVTAMLAVAACLSWWADLHEGACGRLILPEDARPLATRARLSELRREDNLRDRQSADVARARYAEELARLRGSSCRVMEVSSVRALFSSGLSMLGTLAIAFALFLLFVGAVAPLDQASRPRDLALSLMAFVSPWLPLRAYSEVPHVTCGKAPAPAPVFSVTSARMPPPRF